MTEPSELRLRSVFDLLSERFFIPTYQRGYRWTPRQVEALLDDVAEFQRSVRAPNAYYCLQPVVVRRRPSGDWEVVDGQQRLTTISLILGALANFAEMLRRGRFELTYESRELSAEFLKHPTEEKAHLNIDFHHMFVAHSAIKAWFAKHDGALQLDLLRCLTGKDGDGPNVRVIWYELDQEEHDPVQVFVRLNVGRIPLTSAELIRAVLLRKDRGRLDPRDAQQITHDWDAIERRLGEDEYWYFLQSSTGAIPARIEHLFDVFVRMKRDVPFQVRADDPLATFLDFQRVLESAHDERWPVWLDFKRMAQALEDWYEDRTLFHLVGYLVATALFDSRRLLLDLLKARQDATGTEFERHLRRLIWKRLMGQGAADYPVAGLTKTELHQRISERLDAIEYPSDSIRPSLLLFNIASLLSQEASSQRFQFDAYKRNAWDIEHVRSVAEYSPGAAADKRRWLEHARDFASSPVALGINAEESERLREQIEAMLAAPSLETEAFASVFADVRALSGEGEARKDDDALSNLVLLDAGTNRSYRNAVFPVKRSWIISLDKKGQFVPPATRNVFLKYYTPQAAQLFLWDQADQEAYARELERTLVDFFGPLMREEDAA